MKIAKCGNLRTQVIQFDSRGDVIDEAILSLIVQVVLFLFCIGQASLQLSQTRRKLPGREFLKLLQ
ncbi:MAG: hypothetical protein ACYTE3_13120 [Planctomycetota bacterium]